MMKRYNEGDFIPIKYAQYIDSGKWTYVEIEDCMFGFIMKTDTSTIRIWKKTNPNKVGYKNITDNEEWGDKHIKYTELEKEPGKPW